MKKVHYRDGCAWASGDLQMADTAQTTNWDEVTCWHCLRKRSDDFDGASWYHAQRYMPDGTCPCGCRKEVPHGRSYATPMCQKRHYMRRFRRGMKGAISQFGRRVGDGYKAK